MDGADADTRHAAPPIPSPMPGVARPGAGLAAPARPSMRERVMNGKEAFLPFEGRTDGGYKAYGLEDTACLLSLHALCRGSRTRVVPVDGSPAPSRRPTAGRWGCVLPRSWSAGGPQRAVQRGRRGYPMRRHATGCLRYHLPMACRRQAAVCTIARYSSSSSTSCCSAAICASSIVRKATAAASSPSVRRQAAR